MRPVTMFNQEVIARLEQHLQVELNLAIRTIGPIDETRRVVDTRYSLFLTV